MKRPLKLLMKTLFFAMISVVGASAGAANSLCILPFLPVALSDAPPVRLTLPLETKTPLLKRFPIGRAKFERANRKVVETYSAAIATRGREITKIAFRESGTAIEITASVSRVHVDSSTVSRPDWLAAQDKALASLADPGTIDWIYAPSSRERYFDSRDSMLQSLTAKTIEGLPPGRYAFALLPGESSLRIGFGHHIIGERRDAIAAGDIDIRVNADTGGKEVVFLSPRSDTYRPFNSSLVHAVRALWSSGIFPRRLELRDWNNTDVLLVLD